MSLTLIPISRAPEQASVALQWSLDLWGGHIPGFSSQDWRDFYAHALVGDYQRWNPEGTSQELIFLALDSERLIGAIALVDFDDLEEFRYLKPWVAAFVIDPALRGKGFGTAILKLFESEVSELGVEKLYLWSEDQGPFYEKRGYHLVVQSGLNEITFGLYSKDLRTMAP